MIWYASKYLDFKELNRIAKSRTIETVLQNLPLQRLVTLRENGLFIYLFLMHHPHHTDVWILFSCACDGSCLRQSTLYLHLLRWCRLPLECTISGPSKPKNNKTPTWTQGEWGGSRSTCTNWHTTSSILKKRVGPRRKGCWESGRVRGMQTDKGFLSVKRNTVSFSVCVYVCKRERKRERGTDRKQRGGAGAEERSELL